MGQYQSSLVVFTCDGCGLELEVESLTTLTPTWPPGWMSINPSRPEHDMFCSWKCLGDYAHRRHEEREARAAQAKAKAK